MMELELLSARVLHMQLFQPSYHHHRLLENTKTKMRRRDNHARGSLPTIVSSDIHCSFWVPNYLWYKILVPTYKYHQIFSVEHIHSCNLKE